MSNIQIIDVSGKKLPREFENKYKSIWDTDPKTKDAIAIREQSLQPSIFDPLSIALGGAISKGALRGAEIGSQKAGQAFRKSIQDSMWGGNPDMTRRAIDSIAIGTQLTPKNMIKRGMNTASGIADGLSFGISSPLTSISKPISAVSNLANDIAALRHYRMGKVAGDPSAVAFGKTYFAQRLEPLVHRVERYDKLLNRDIGANDIWNYMFPIVSGVNNMKQFVY